MNVLDQCIVKKSIYDYYKIAGRVDCIAEWDEFYLSLILKQVQKNEKIVGTKTITYSSAYAEMYQERTLQEIEQIVILVVTEDGTVQEFVKKKHQYLHLLDKELNMYYNTSKTGI